MAIPFIPVLALKLGQKLLGLNDKFKDALRSNLLEAKSLITDELPMVLSDLGQILIQG